MNGLSARTEPAESLVRRRSAPLRVGLLAALLLSSGPTGVQAQDTHRYVLDPESSRVWFEASASTGSFRGEAERVRGWAELADTTYTRARGEVEVEVATLRTGISLRNQHLRDEMEVDRYPLVRFRLDRVEAQRGAAEGATRRAVVLHGTLTIKETPRSVQIPATASQRGDTLRVRGRSLIRLSDFGIQPPSRLLGIARMHDELVLVFDVAFVRSVPAGTALGRGGYYRSPGDL